MIRRWSSTVPILALGADLPRAWWRDRLPPDRAAAVQSRLLRQLVRHAYTRVPYYRDTLDPAAVAGLATAADLADLPVLDRRVLNQLGPGPLLADGFSPANTQVTHTSGSSGIPVTLYFSPRDLRYLRATWLWDLLACGLRPTDRVGYFRVGGFRRHRLERLGVARNVHVSTGLDLDQQAAAFLAGRPTFVWGFPNAIAALVAELKRRGIRYRGVRTVVFSGESLAGAAREEVLGYFGARSHELYATVEMNTIARSCPHGSLHLRSADVVVEVEQDGGPVAVADGASELTGEILVTRLRAEAMPLLRYRLGDRVRIGPNDCPCGVRRTPVVREILGRVEDRLITRDGRTLNGDYLAVRLRSLPGVRQMQIVQRRPGAVEVVLVPADHAPADLVSQVERAVAPAAGSFAITVRTGAVTTEPSGKIRQVKSYC